MRSRGRWLFWLRNLLAGIPALYSLFSTLGEWKHDLVIWPLAATFLCAGIAVRAWASCHCNYGRSSLGPLTRTGPYVYVRNPLYVGNILILTGATLASRVLWLVPVSIIWSAMVYSAVVAFEEPRLLKKYGDEYRRYCSEVRAWLPSLRPDEGRPRSGLQSYPTILMTESVKLLWLLPFVLKEYWSL
jgi:protein-S-isoprenylcysteine O-methyltransferase Ste14